MTTRFSLATFLVGATLASLASADVLTFDDLALPDGTAVTNQYAGLGVVFFAPVGDTTRLVTASSPIFPAGPQGLYNDDPAHIPSGFTQPIIGFAPRGTFLYQPPYAS